VVLGRELAVQIYTNSLVDLNLSFNNTERPISQTLKNHYNLQLLDLSNNSISGEVPDLSKLYFLNKLYLFYGQLKNRSFLNVSEKLFKLQVLNKL
jgi:hypothetical protein